MADSGLTQSASPIAISGVGLVTSLGWGMKSSFDRLSAGHSGATTGTWNIRPGLALPWAGYPLPEAGPVPEKPWDDPVFSILDHASREALADAGLSPGQIDPNRIGVVVSLSKGAVKKLSQQHFDSHHGQYDPGCFLDSSPSAGAAFVASLAGATGPCMAPVTACASGLTALRHGAGLLERGLVDIVLAGAADASLEPLLYSAFARMRSLAGPIHPAEPVSRWLRPWSARRNGFLIGEGGAVFLLQRLSDVDRTRNPNPLVIERFSAGSEAFHPTRPRLTTDILERVIARAFPSGPTDHPPDMVHLHATATREFDLLEFQAMVSVLGKSIAHPWFVASKPAVGHCLGAAGAVELAISCEALRRQVVPPFAPAIDSEMGHFVKTPGAIAQDYPLQKVLKIVAGFGGHIEVCLINRL